MGEGAWGERYIVKVPAPDDPTLKWPALRAAIFSCHLLRGAKSTAKQTTSIRAKKGCGAYSDPNITFRYLHVVNQCLELGCGVLCSAKYLPVINNRADNESSGELSL